MASLTTDDSSIIPDFSRKLKDCSYWYCPRCDFFIAINDTTRTATCRHFLHIFDSSNPKRRQVRQERG